jgi:hemerythrin-like domain-containing protein
MARPKEVASAKHEGPQKREGEEEEVSATEDLMREHGVLRRVLIAYREAERRLRSGVEVPADALVQAGVLVRQFIEDYHERDEEEFIFPPLVKAKRLTNLVVTLKAQHQAGRALTLQVLKLATPGTVNAPDTRLKLADTLAAFVRMYEPHAAREDTVLFPAFRQLVGPRELERLRNVFEAREHALPGGGFEERVEAVAAIEQSLGIEDLSRFTPRAGIHGATTSARP